MVEESEREGEGEGGSYASTDLSLCQWGCLKDKGEFETSGCAEGWTGVNCQGRLGWER